MELLRHVVGQSSLAGDLRETLTATLARLLFWLGREPSAEARLVLARTPDGQCAAEMRWILAYLHYRRGRRREAAEEVRRALADADVSDMWRDLHLRLRAALADDRPVTSVLDVARLLDAGPLCQDLSPAVARRMAPYRAIPGEIHLAGAVGGYWAGRWHETTDEVRTILRGQRETAPYLLRTPGAVLLVHGLAALVAGHRGEGRRAREFLAAAARQSFPHGGRRRRGPGGDGVPARGDRAARRAGGEPARGARRAHADPRPRLSRARPPPVAGPAHLARDARR